MVFLLRAIAGRRERERYRHRDREREREICGSSTRLMDVAAAAAAAAGAQGPGSDCIVMTTGRTLTREKTNNKENSETELQPFFLMKSGNGNTGHRGGRKPSPLRGAGRTDGRTRACVCKRLEGHCSEHRGHKPRRCWEPNRGAPLGTCPGAVMNPSLSAQRGNAGIVSAGSRLKQQCYLRSFRGETFLPLPPLPVGKVKPVDLA